MKKSLIIFLALALAIPSLLAQQSFLSAEWENDGSTVDTSQPDNDKWYTNGIRMKFGLPFFVVRNTREDVISRNKGLPVSEQIDPKKVENYDYIDLGGNISFRSPVNSDAYRLNDSMFAHFADSAFWMVFEVAQNMYTPMELSFSEPQYDDRPYAGWSRFGWSILRQKSNRMQRVGLDLGMLGEAGAGVTQTMVHYLVDGAEHPEGWPTHIKDRFAFQLLFGDQVDCLPEWAKWAFDGRYYWASFTSSYEIQMGNVLISAQYKPLVRFGLFKENTIMSPTPIIPSMPKMLSRNSRTTARQEDEPPEDSAESLKAEEGEKNQNAEPGNKKDSPVEIFLFISPGISGVTYDGTLDHQADPNYRITLVPLRASLEIGLEIDLINTFCPKFPLKRLFARWSPVYYNSPEFAVDNNWSKLESDVVPDNFNIIGRWYVGGSWGD